MSELDANDVESFTGGRLVASDPQVEVMLSAALNTARNYCGWMVTPVVTDDAVTLDGPDSRILILPTRKLIELTSISEDDTVLDLSTLRWGTGGPPGYNDRPVAVRKKTGGWWKSYYQCIDVVMTHGYTEEEASDWRYAVLSMVNQMSLSIGSTGTNILTTKRVDDVSYSYADPFSAMAEQALFSMKSILDGYTIPSLEFL